MPTLSIPVTGLQSSPPQGPRAWWETKVECQLVGGLEYVAKQGGPRFLSRGECFSFAQVRLSPNATGTPGTWLLLCSSVLEARGGARGQSGSYAAGSTRAGW